MASKATVQRQRSAEKVIAAGRTHKERIGAAIGDRYGAKAGEAGETLVTVVTDDLDAKTDAMVRADDAHEVELRDDPSAREARDAAADALNGRLVVTRQQLTAVAGEGYVAKIGFSGSTPRDPVAVLRLGRTVVIGLATESPPPALIPNYEVDPDTWRQPLESLVNELDGHTQAVATEERETEATLVAKRAAIDAYDQAFSATATLISNLLAMAGEYELAKRVRPSSRRPGQTVEDAPAEGSIAFSAA